MINNKLKKATAEIFNCFNRESGWEKVPAATTSNASEARSMMQIIAWEAVSSNNFLRSGEVRIRIVVLYRLYT